MRLPKPSGHEAAGRCAFFLKAHEAEAHPRLIAPHTSAGQWQSPTRCGGMPGGCWTEVGWGQAGTGLFGDALRWWCAGRQPLQSCSELSHSPEGGLSAMDCLMRLAQGACCSKTTLLASSYTASSRPTLRRVWKPRLYTQSMSTMTGVKAPAMIPQKVGPLSLQVCSRLGSLPMEYEEVRVGTFRLLSWGNAGVLSS